MSYKKTPASHYPPPREKRPAQSMLGRRRPAGQPSRVEGFKASGEPKARSNVYVPYYSSEFKDIVQFIQTELRRKVYLIGIRAMFERGVPLWRFTDDFDVYTPLTEEERDRIIDFARGKYEGAKHVWSRFGFSLDFDPIGHVDVNIVPPTVQDETWDRDAVKINGVQVFLPPLEDILVMKLLSPRRKDLKDAGVALRLGREKVNFERLKARAEKAGVAKKLLKVAQRYGVEL